MKGLKKDHQRLADLLFAHLHTLQQNLTTLLKSLTHEYPEHYEAFSSLLEEITKVNITEKYLLAITSPDSDQHIPQLEATLLPIHLKVLTLLGSLPDTKHFTGCEEVMGGLSPIMEKYTTFLKHCDYTTQFHASPYSGADVMFVGFDNYDEQYDDLLDSLYDFGYVLDDWTEGLLKSSYEEDTMKTFDGEMFTVDGLDDGACPNFGIGVF